MGGAGHGVVIESITCGGCGHLMQVIEGSMSWQCVNAKCEYALKEFQPRIIMDEIIGRRRETIPGVET